MRRDTARFVLAIAPAFFLLAASGCERVTPATPPIPTSDVEVPEDEALRKRLDDVLHYTYHYRHLNTRDHAAWQILHGALGYGRAFLIYDDQEKLVSAVDYVLRGGRMKGWNLRPGAESLPDARRGVVAVLEVGTGTGQGHPDQWLAVLSQCGVEAEEKLIVHGQEFMFADLVAQAKWDVPLQNEWSWTIIGLMRYLPVDEVWPCADGQQRSLDDVIRLEAGGNFRNVSSAACGGTHRLIGMTMARNQYLREFEELPAGSGWALAEERIDEAVKLARAYQQPDGSFSANWFSGPGYTPDVADRLGKTGHTIEFLTFALTDEQLADEWVTRGVLHLCKLLEDSKEANLECGALYHAIHGLVLYRERRFGALDFDAWAKEALARQSISPTGEKSSPFGKSTADSPGKTRREEPIPADPAPPPPR